MKKVKETQVQSELSNQIKFIWDFFPSNSAVRSKKNKILSNKNLRITYQLFAYEIFHKRSDKTYSNNKT